MITVAVTQRVDVIADYGERRDALDQNWTRFLAACDLCALLVPNEPMVAMTLLDRVSVAGLLLTGGNDLACCGGNAPERDQTEAQLIQHARRIGLPVFGVCRGMQMLLHTFGAKLVRVEGHVAQFHDVYDVSDQNRARSLRQVNSYHAWGATDVGPVLTAIARSEDGTVEAIRHPVEPITGIMWHPERNTPFDKHDVTLFRTFFGAFP